VARVSIYVSDELKARMDAVGEAVNWSEVARPAFVSAVASDEHRRGQNMTTVLERLRASKGKYMQERAAGGKDAGRDWASNVAEYLELKKVADISEEGDDWAIHGLTTALELEFYDLTEYLKITPEEFTSGFAEAFVEGAKEVYHRVEDQL